MALTRTMIATAGTLVALGGLTAFALGAGDARPEAEPAGAQPQAARTEVVTRTIRRDGDGAARSAVVPVSSPSGSDDGDRRRGRDDRGSDDRHHDDDDDRGRGRGRGRGGDDGFDDRRGPGGGDDVFDDHRGHDGDDDDSSRGRGRGHGGDDH